MRRKRWVGFLLAAFALSACGDDTGAVHAGPKRDASTIGSAGRSSTSHRDAGTSMDGGDEPSDAAVPVKPKDSGTGVMPGVDPAAPLIEFLEPKALKDPNSGDVLTTPMVTVRCKVTKSSVANAHDVNQASVLISLLDSDPKKSIKGVVKNEGNGEFSADFDLTSKLNGLLRFGCDASDVGKPALTGHGTVETFLDLGPTIELLEPGDGTAHILAKSVEVRFRVTPGPAALDDTQATPTDIHLVVLGQEYAFTEDPNEPGLYHESINFNDPTQFPMPPTSAEIVVSASSSRMPTAAKRTVQADITIDAEGPVIVIKTPKNEEVVHGDVEFALEITDPSGIDPSSVVAEIALGDQSYPLTNWVVTGKNYVDHFDTSGFDRTLSQMTINVRATDNVGNESHPAPILLFIDNVPPIISLDPPYIREFKIQNDTTICSDSFDPVGIDATSDKQAVEVESLYRAMIWDRTNEARGQIVLFQAGVNNATAKIYTQPELEIPLLIDKDGDPNHVCDEINDPADHRAVALALLPIARKGTAPYSINANFTTDLYNNPDPTVGCTAPAANTTTTDLCASSDLFRAIGQPLDATSPPGAIFAPGATGATTGACNGITWDLYHKSNREGWMCVAARVEDNRGNVGISTPLRVCVSDGVPDNGVPDCNISSNPPPTCTDGCVLPDQFDHNMVLLAK